MSGGQLEFGTPEFQVELVNPVRPLVQLEDVGVATAVLVDQTDFDLSVVDERIYEVELVQSDFNLHLEDAAIEVTAVVVNVNLSEYEQRLLELYSYYGTGTVAKNAFTLLDRLVRIELYEAGIGLTNE